MRVVILSKTVRIRIFSETNLQWIWRFDPETPPTMSLISCEGPLCEYVHSLQIIPSTLDFRTNRTTFFSPVFTEICKIRPLLVPQWKNPVFTAAEWTETSPKKINQKNICSYLQCFGVEILSIEYCVKPWVTYSLCDCVLVQWYIVQCNDRGE